MISRTQPGAPPGTGHFLLLLLTVLLARSLVTFPIEHVDAAFKYLAAADIVRGHHLDPLLLNHHTMRWSEVLPQVLVTWATGFRYEGLYLLPLLAFATYCTLIWRGMAPVLGLSQQVLLLALLFIEPLGLQHTGQLLNPPFGVAYSIMAVTVLVRPGHASWIRYVGATLLFFAAYGAHSTYLAFFAGGMAWVAFGLGRPGVALGMTAGMAALLGLESAAFNTLAGNGLTGGRIEALAGGGHLRAVNERFPAVAGQELLTRWLDLPAFGLFVTAGYLACAAWLGVSRRARREAPAFVSLCLLVGGAYALAITFAVVSVNPLRPVMPLRPMYLAPFMPYAVVGTVYLLSRLGSRLRRSTRLWLEGASVVALLLLVVGFAAQKDSLERVVNYRMNAFLWQAQDQMGRFAERFRAGEILLVGRNRWALEMLVKYAEPTPVLRHNPRPRVTSAPAVSAGARCVSGLRRIPLERNERACRTPEREAVIEAGAKLRTEDTEANRDSL